MSYRFFFELSTGVAKPLRVPRGTLQQIRDHVAAVERATGLKAEESGGCLYWRQHWHDWSQVDDETLCRVAMEHNEWVRALYTQFAEWSKTSVRGKEGEEITPEDAKTFWYALKFICPPVERWTAAYYFDEMEHVYEVLRGRPSRGVVFDANALTPKQAAAVLVLFSEYLDTHDIRIDVPHGRDQIASSDDGGYRYCENCGRSVAEGDEYHCRRRKCPLREEEEGD